MINYWHNHPLIKLFAYLVLGLMTINPAFALQYQQFDDTADFLSKIPDYQPRAYHIHISQKNDVLALLKKQGYDVIPASENDTRLFLSSNAFSQDRPVQLAANFNLDKVYEDECSYSKKYCYREECDKYPKKRRNDCPEEEPPIQTTATKTPTQTSVSLSAGGNINIPDFGGSGSGRDAAAFMLIVIGVVVVAALFIYAGKWLVDLISHNEDYYAYWWDIGSQFIRLDTGANQHGNLTGIKFSGGFIPNRHTQFGLAVEAGHMNLDLVYNRNSTPQRLDIAGTYWFLGPTVRWLLGYTDTEKLVHNSYLYLNFLGGGMDRDEVDLIAVARIGFNTGLGRHLRLGIHYGAFYLGLDEDQGFVNDGDDYWNMYGLEIGYQF